MVNNGWVPCPPATRVLHRCTIAVTALTAAATLTGCGAGHPPSLTDPTPSSAIPTGPVDAVGQLAGLAAAAHDQRYVAAYTLSGTGTPGRSLLASLATDGTWQVDVEGGATRRWRQRRDHRPQDRDVPVPVEWAGHDGHYPDATTGGTAHAEPHDVGGRFGGRLGQAVELDLGIAVSVADPGALSGARLRQGRRCRQAGPQEI